MNQPIKRSHKNLIRFSVLGFLAGLLPPVISTIVEGLRSGISLYCISCMVEFNFNSFMLLVMDSTPIVVGFLAGLAGAWQDRMLELQQETRNRLEEQTQLRNDFQQLSTELEARVEERTLELEKRSRYLEAAAEVGRAATSIYRLEELLPQVADYISQRFEFYQVGVFILDENGEYAVMRAASSDGGKQMLARNHKLKVGEQGIVGYVTSTGKARIALDVGEDAVHFNNPELPNTRSEMALPLFYGGRLIGAVDVQSETENAFSEDDISALRVLADQVSMAINNAMLFEELQTSLEAERKLFGDISREAWREMLQRSERFGYRFSRGSTQVFPTETAWPQDMIEAAITNQIIKEDVNGSPSIAIPILVSGQMVGVIRLRKDTGAVNWTDDEIDFAEIITERLSQALEGSRLFYETQKQAAREQMTSSISAQFRQSLDIEAVMKTAVKELSEAFNAKEVMIRMTPDDSTN